MLPRAAVVISILMDSMLSTSGLPNLMVHRGISTGPPIDKKPSDLSRIFRRDGSYVLPLALRSAPGRTSTIKQMSPERVEALLQEGRRHLHFAISLCHLQLRDGLHFLFEHPSCAKSWHDNWMVRLLEHPRVTSVVSDQCMYGLTTPSEKDPSVRLPAMKPTKFMTSSPAMASQLSRRCDKKHVHQHLTGGRCKDAAFYPPKLVRAILKGISLQAVQDRLASKGLQEESFPICAMPMPVPSNNGSCYAFGDPKTSKIPKMNGGSVPVVFAEENFKKITFLLK